MAGLLQANYPCCRPTFFFLRCRVVVDNVGDHVMPEQSVFCRPDELGWAYVILQTDRLSKYFCLCRPLAPLPSTFPVTTSVSLPCLLMTCPKKSSCLCLIVFINVRWTPAALSTSRLLFFFVHEIFSILLKNHISTAQPLHQSTKTNVHSAIWSMQTYTEHASSASFQSYSA